MPIDKHLGFAFACSVAGAVCAQPPGDYAHARHGEANDRTGHQDKRIREEHQRQEITARSAHESHTRHIDERSMSTRHNGPVTSAEQYSPDH